MNRKSISVVIPTYNHGKYVCEAIDSVVNQTYSDIEIIVVDDGSTDDTRERITKYGSKITYVYQQNQGLSAARNTGIRKARYDYIAFLDADDLWLPEKLETQMKVFETQPNVALVTCGYYWVDSIAENIVESVVGKRFLTKNELINAIVMENVISGSGSGVIVRRECFFRVGFFDQSLKSAEDWDMWLRIVTEYEVGYVEQQMLKIRQRSDSMSSASNADKMINNELAVLNKFFLNNPQICSTYLKNKAYAYRYSRAAWASDKVLDRARARRYMLRALWINPLYCLKSLVVIRLMIKIFLGI